VDAFDIAALKYLLRCGSMTHTQRRAADVNGDAGVDTEDLQLLTDFVLARGTFADAESGAAVYYAVDAAYNRGYEESTNAGFTSDAYLNLDNVTGSFVEFTVTVPEDGNYLCTFKIANGSTNNRSMKIEVNQGTDYWMQDFLSTGSWTTWMERGIVLPLTAGTNLIRLTSATGDGGPNIDYLRTELTEEPIAEVYVPEEEPEESQSGTTIYIAGDSTVQTYRASYAPQQGWGAYLGDYFTDDVTVSNHAIAGRSSKSFYDNGRLDTILDEIQEGDYLLVQFGINDSAYNNEERYAPVCGSVPGTDGSFEYYIAKYIEGAKEKGATPVLVTTVLGLKAYNSTTGKFEGSYSNYCNAMKQLAAYYDVPCIDLNALMVEHYNEIGYDAAYQYHLISTELSDTDMTHFTETGANAVAGLVAEAIRNLDLPVSSKVK
jgi:lysophospholipase L1-like esterase